MSNRRWIGVLLLILLFIVGAAAIGAVAYHAGLVHGAVGSGGRIVYARPYGFGYGWGLLPFGFFLFPLFFVMLIIGIRLAVLGSRRRWHGGGWGGPGPWGHGGPGGPDGPGAGPRERIEAWHREAHERESRGEAASAQGPSSA